MKGVWALILLQAAAFHPVWVWYVKRIRDGSDEPWGPIALGVCILLTAADGTEGESGMRRFTIPALFTFAYAITFPFVPPLISACLAVIAIGSSIGLLRYGAPFHAPIWGLLLLSLPIIASSTILFRLPDALVLGRAHSAHVGTIGFDVNSGGELPSLRPPPVVHRRPV